MGALKSSGAIRNTLLAYLSAEASRGSSSSSVLPLIQGLADPIYLSSFMSPKDISGGLVNLDLAFGRFTASAPFLAGSLARLRVDQLDRLNSLPGFSNVTGYAFNTANPQLVTVPSECSLWIDFPGSAGIIQSKGATPSASSLTIETAGPNNHGAIFVSGLWLMGDPTLGVGTADALSFMKISVAWDSWLWDMRILGYLGAQRILDVSGESQLHIRGIHFSRSSALSGSGPNANLYIIGNEFGIQVEDVEFLATQPPANVPTPASKDLGMSPGLYRDFTGNVGATGDIYRNIIGGDFLSALLVVKPTSGFVGPQTFWNIWSGTNCAQGGAGAMQVSAASGGVRGGVTVYGGDCTLNGSGQPAWAFNSLSCPVTMHNVRVNQETLVFSFDFTSCTGPVMLNECSTDTPGQRVPITGTTTPGLIHEVFNGIRSRYYVNTGGVGANLGVTWTGARLVETFVAGTDPQNVAGISAVTALTNVLVPIQDPGQADVVITADATAGGIPSGSLFKPSAATAGTFAAVAAGNRASGQAQEAISASSTGHAQLA